MANTFGPYDREDQTHQEPMPLEVRALHDSGRTRSGDPDCLVRDTKLRHLLAACEHAGVDLGVYDRWVLRWLGGWEPSTVQVLIGIISRAGARG